MKKLGVIKLIFGATILIGLLQISMFVIGQGTSEMRKRGREIAGLIATSETIKNMMNCNGITLYEVTFHSTMFEHHISLLISKELSNGEKKQVSEQINLYLENILDKKEKVIIHYKNY